MTGRRRVRGEAGSATIEAVVGIPVFFLLVLFVVAAGRMVLAQQSVQAAAAASTSQSVTDPRSPISRARIGDQRLPR